MKPNIDRHKPKPKTFSIIVVGMLAGLLIASFYCLGSDIIELENRIEKQERLTEPVEEQIKIQNKTINILIEILKKHHHDKFT
jgi:hypothetical protein